MAYGKHARPEGEGASFPKRANEAPRRRGAHAAAQPQGSRTAAGRDGVRQGAPTNASHVQVSQHVRQNANPGQSARVSRAGYVNSGQAARMPRAGHAAPPSVPTMPSSAMTGGQPPRRRMPKRFAALIAAALVVAFVGVGGVIAWLTTSNQVENQFEIGTVEPGVNEDGPDEDDPFEPGVDTVKQNVSVTNKGNVPIYVRAQVNIYWQNAAGNQLWEQPEEETDYTLEGDLPANDSWTKGSDGFYYWTSPLDAGATTENLIDSLKWITANSYDDRQLVCDIAVQGIQADPADAVKEAWGVAIANDGTLTPPAASGAAGTGSDTSTTTDITAEEA